MTINECLTLVNNAKEYEIAGSYYNAAQKYKEAKERFEELKEYKLYAQCLKAEYINMIKYYQAGRDIEALSVNIIELYIKKIENGVEGAEVTKFDEYEILISSYNELERVFKEINMINEANEMYYRKTKLYHKYYWRSPEKRPFSSIFHLFIHSFCGHGERPWWSFVWIMSWIVLFSVIFKCFHLIAFTAPDKTICFSQSLYFSVVTFTTLGYGDIVPKGPVGQFFISFEVLVGYLMLSALVALIFRKITR